MPAAATKPKDYPATPELDKIKKISDHSQAIGEFLDWLLNEREPRLSLGQYSEEEEVPCQRRPPENQRLGDDLLDMVADLKGGRARHSQPVGHPRTCVCGGTGWVSVKTSPNFYPIHVRIQTLLAEFFKIDENEAERERMRVLEWVRAQNKEA